MKLTTQREPDRAVVFLVGEHEGYAAQKLERTLAELLTEQDRVEVDLTRTLFIDSEVAAVLVAARKRADAEGAHLEIVVGRETGWPVLRLLELTGLAAVLGVVKR